MSSQKIARRYAAALFDQVKGDAQQQKTLDEQLSAIAEVFKDKELKKIIANPIVSSDVLTAVFDELNKQVKGDEKLKQFFRVLISARRTGLVPDVQTAFHSLYLASQNNVEAQVVSAVKLEATELDAIKSKLETLLGKKVILETAIDKSLLGGFVVKIDNSLIDMSLKTKLDNMTKFAVS